jgi:hypothetical protein
MNTTTTFQDTREHLLNVPDGWPKPTAEELELLKFGIEHPGTHVEMPVHLGNGWLAHVLRPGCLQPDCNHVDDGGSVA